MPRPLTADELRAGQAAPHVVIGFALDGDERALLLASPVPVVTVGGRVEGVPEIGIPEEVAVAMVVEHLAGLGHRRIGHIGGGQDEAFDPAVPVARPNAWAATLHRLGAEHRPAWLCCARGSTGPHLDAAGVQQRGREQQRGA